MDNLQPISEATQVIPQTSDVAAAYTRTLTKNTYMAYVNTIKEFFSVLDINEITKYQIQSVTPDVANAWANEMVAAGLSKGTVNRKLSAMKNFYTFLCRKHIGWADYNPFDTSEGCIRFKNASKEYSDKRTLTSDEIKHFFDTIQNEFPESEKDPRYIQTLRDLIVCQILATTGARRDEIANLKIGDLSFDYGRHIATITGKGDKSRIILITEPIWENIKKYLRLRKLSLTDVELPLLIGHSNVCDNNNCISGLTVYRIVKKYAELSGLGVDDISPHNFRHTFCTQSLNMGADLDDVALLMGHATTRTTMRYDHSSRAISRNTTESLSELFSVQAI